MKLCSLLVGAALCTSSPQGVTNGKATVQDGDTIYVNGAAFRLWGVDAEELSEPNGARAKFGLRAIIGEQTVLCDDVKGQSYHRTVSRCSVQGRDLGEQIIKAGLALDCGRYSGGYYRRFEAPGARARLRQKPYC